VVGFGAVTERAYPPAVEALHTVLTETTKRNPENEKQTFE
jgi:hypothetical protein